MQPTTAISYLDKMHQLTKTANTNDFTDLVYVFSLILVFLVVVSVIRLLFSFFYLRLLALP